MTLRTYIDRAIRDGAAFDAVICGCDVQQTFCWQPDMCITNACEAEYRPLLDAEIRILAAAPGERFSIIEICTDRLFLGDAFFRSARRATAARASTGGCFAPDKTNSARPGASALGRAFLLLRFPFHASNYKAAGGARGGKARLESDYAVFQAQCAGQSFCRAAYSAQGNIHRAAGVLEGGKARLEVDSAVFSGIRRKTAPELLAQGDPQLRERGCSTHMTARC